jgi:hypothetical protein
VKNDLYAAIESYFGAIGITQSTDSNALFVYIRYSRLAVLVNQYLRIRITKCKVA